MRFFISVALLSSLLSFSTSWAQFEEYSYFSESEINEINTPFLIDSEYFSDILTYSMPLSMTRDFLKASRAYDLSIGSLSQSRFATQHRLKIDTEMNEYFLFRLAYAEKKDLEENINHMILELQYKVNTFWSLVAYTELLSDKKWNDVGAAVLLRWNPHHELRLYGSLTDFSFAKRTENNEFDKKSSYVVGFVGRLFADDASNTSFLEYYGRLQTPLLRELTDQNIEYSFRDFKTGLRGRSSLDTPSHYLNFDISYKNRMEGEAALTPAVTVDGQWRSDQWNGLVQYENSNWLTGLSTIYRRWKNEIESIDLLTLQPHVWYKVSHGSQLDALRIGYEASWNDLRDIKAVRSPLADVSQDLEHRLNLRYTFYFSKTAFLHLYFTGDLDDPSWEGGNGTFQILF